MNSLLLIAALLGQPAAALDQTPPAAVEPDERPDAKPKSGAEPTDATDDSVIVIDDGSDDALIIIDDESEAPLSVGDESKQPEPTARAAPPASRTWLRAEIVSRLMLDTEQEKTGEDVVEWWNVGDLSIDHKIGRELHAVADARVRWGVAGEDPAPDHTFLVVNPRDSKWTGEVELREGWLGVRLADLELRAGQRIFVWGKNELMAGADVLNPIDLRFDPLNMIESLKDAKVPVFALDALYSIGRSDLQLVVLPFFTPNRGFLVGRDMALAPPGSDLEARIHAAFRVHPSVEDELQSTVFGSQLPEEQPLQSSVALRASTTLASIDLAATAFYGWDRTPRIRLDPDLLLLLDNSEALLANPELLLTDPALRDASLGVQQKALTGEELVRAIYRRMWRLALEGQGVLGDFVVRGDVGFSPGQTYYTAALRSVWKNAMTAVLGVEYMRGETWYVALTGFTVAVFRAPKEEVLIGIEREDADPTERRTAALWGVSGVVRWTEPDWDVEAEINGLYNVEPGDRFGTASLSYSGLEPHVFGIGCMIAEGPKGTIGHNIRRNDFVYLSYRSVW
jgi:hypothetical protein